MGIYSHLGRNFGRRAAIRERYFGFYATTMHATFHQGSLRGACVGKAGMERAVPFHCVIANRGNRYGIGNLFDIIG